MGDNHNEEGHTMHPNNRFNGMNTWPTAPTQSNVQANNNGSDADRPRLSAQAKKENHIASEKKRRLAIREGFDRICDIVPGMTGRGRSEAEVLAATVTHMEGLVDEKEALRAKAREMGWSEGDFEQIYAEEAARNAAGRKKGRDEKVSHRIQTSFECRSTTRCDASTRY